MVTTGVKTGLIKPANMSEVTMLVKNLDFNTPDSLVIDYLNKHGRVMNDKVIYEKDRDGPFKGLFNGNRKYLVDFTKGTNAGSYHILDGAKVMMSYPGQKKTCGRCHQIPGKCPGNGFAQTCEAKNGQRVPLIDHMKAHWDAIGFSPSLFQLNLDDDDENTSDTADAIIKSNETFTPSAKHTNEATISTVKAIGVVIKNLPENFPKSDAMQFLASYGLEKGKGKLKIHRNKKNTNIDVEDIDDAIANLLIKNIHEKIFFNKKVYCRALVHVHTPSKDAPLVDDKASDVNASPLLKPIIPGLSQEDIKKADRKIAKEAKKKDKLMKKSNDDHSEDGKGKKREDFLKNPSLAGFRFDGESEDSSSDEEAPGLQWSKSPLESADPDIVNLPLLNKETISNLKAPFDKQNQKDQLLMSVASKRALSTSPSELEGRRNRSKSSSHNC